MHALVPAHAGTDACLPRGSQAPVDTVVFDIGRVIVEWDLRLIYRDLIADADERERFVAEVVSEAWHSEHDTGRPAADMVAERSAEFPRHADLIAAWADRFNDSIPGTVAGVPEIIERLNDAGVPLYAITNFGACFWERFRPTLPLLGVFRDIVVSGVERLIKPDPAIYALAAKRFGIDPARTLFIDDSAANIEAARDCGWQGHHFTGADRLNADLRARGLLA